MTAESTALSRTESPEQRIAMIARAPKPPAGLPITQEDWDAYSTEDREHAASVYVTEMTATAQGIKPEFPRIKMPTGGATMFTMPDGSIMKELVGIVVFHNPARAFWKSRGSNTPPDCSSYDGLVPASGEGPAPSRAKTCATCRMNEFGSSDKGRGKACKEMMQVWFWMDDQILPNFFPLPVMSIKPFNQFVSGLLNGKRPLTSVRVRIRLDKRQNQGGDPYAVIVPSIADDEPVKFAEMNRAIAMRARFIDEMQKRGVTEADVVTDDDPPDEPGSHDRIDKDDPPPRTDAERPTQY